MNLAEIRKKAQKEQQGSKERADLPLAVPEECEPEAEEPIQGEADILDGLAVPPAGKRRKQGSPRLQRMFRRPSIPLPC